MSDGAGGAIVTWYDNRSSLADVYAQHILASGAVDPAWPANGRVVCSAAGNQTSPSIVQDDAGGAIIAWQDTRSGATSDIYAQHVLANGSVDPLWPANGRALCVAAGNQTAVFAVADASGGAVVLWQDQRAGATDDIYATRVHVDGSVDPAWPVDGRALCTAVGIQQRVRAVPDGAGGAIATWYDQRAGATDDIYAQRVRSDGVVDPGWAVDGLAICTAAGVQQTPSIIRSGPNAAIVTWYDERAGATNGDIYAQRVLLAGSVDPGWPADGRVVCSAIGKQQLPVLVEDGANGAIIGWQDARGASSDIYAERIRSDGVVDPAWPVDGTALCTAANTQSSPAIASDGYGGAILVWTDFRANVSVSDLYAQRVLASGAVDAGWPANGAAVSTATNLQTSPRILADGSGGAIIAWADSRNGSSNFDIFAGRVQASGQLGGDVVGVPGGPGGAAIATRLLPSAPHPARGGTSVRFALAAAGRATVSLYGVDGRLVRQLADGWQAAGLHSIAWNGRDDRGNRAAPGVYFLRLQAAGHQETARLVVVE